MDQGCFKMLRGPIYICIFIGLNFLTGCKDRGEGPKSPDLNQAVTQGNPQPVSGDVIGEKQELPEIPGDGTVVNTGAANTATNTLPEKFMTGLVDCQKLGRYFDLQIASCTDTSLADYACDLTVLLSEQSAVLKGPQKQLLKEYVDKNLQGFSLYACTVDESKPALHFYKVEVDKIRAHNVKIASP